MRPINRQDLLQKQEDDLAEDLYIKLDGIQHEVKGYKESPEEMAKEFTDAMMKSLWPKIPNHINGGSAVSEMEFKGLVERASLRAFKRRFLETGE